GRSPSPDSVQQPLRRGGPMNISYNAYISSTAWQHSPARLQELAASGYRCRLCNASRAEARLEVHHRTYARLGRERPGDLTTLCEDCHLVVTDHLRRRRYRGWRACMEDVRRLVTRVLV